MATKTLALTVALLAAAVISQSSAGSQTCTTRPLEVVFAVDLSSSLAVSGFNNLIQFLQSIADHLPIAPDQTRPAVIGYSTHAKVEIDLGEVGNAQSFIKAVEKIPYYRGLTATGPAMQTARTAVFSKSRPGASKLLVVVTDGIANIPGSLAEARALVRAESAELLKQDIRIHAVGVGDNHLREELIAIAGSDDYSMTDSYESLKTLVSSLAKEICEDKRPKCQLIETTPAQLTGYASRVNECFEFIITGTISGGNIWGTGVYTADSIVSKAAVHAGVVKPGEVNWVRVRVLLGRDNYQAANQNGVSSLAFGSYSLSYEFLGGSIEHVKPGCKLVQEAPGSLASYTASSVNECFEFLIKGTNSGSVWGSSIYTSDSTLRKAAVHAGTLKPDEVKVVRVRVLPGQSAYLSTNRNGILSTAFNSWPLSYEFMDEEKEEVKPTTLPPTTLKPACQSVEPVPASLVGYGSNANECFELRVTGTDAGGLWGSGVYTADSILGKAAVHAGLLKIGETKVVRARVLPGQASYQTTHQNGITSSAYGSYHLSYEFITHRR